MRSIQQRWLEIALLLLSFLSSCTAFQTRQFFRRQTTLEVMGGEIGDLASMMSVSGHEIPTDLATILSTTFSMAAPVHSNPLFGAPDPYLAAGKSIAPSAKAWMEMGITPVTTANDLVPDASETFQRSVNAAMSKGWKILDASRIHGTNVNHLPGFSDTRGIFAARQAPYEDAATFGAEVKWAVGYYKVMDKLPFVAFYYTLLEFFVLRPGIDLYKEEVEDDPDGVLADTISVSIVRMGAFALLATGTVLVAG